MAKILIVDDEPMVRTALGARLMKAGYQVFEAANGEEALLMSENHAPDLILLDCMLPKVDGWQVCRMLKNNPKTQRIAVVMLTAADQQISELRGWECGADEYITKPWDAQRLMDIVDSLLAPRRTKAL